MKTVIPKKDSKEYKNNIMTNNRKKLPLSLASMASPPKRMLIHKDLSSGSLFLFLYEKNKDKHGHRLNVNCDEKLFKDWNINDHLNSFSSIFKKVFIIYEIFITRDRKGTKVKRRNILEVLRGQQYQKHLLNKKLW